MSDQTLKPFPGIRQSVVIFVVLLVSMVVFSPILFLKEVGLSKELSFLIYYIFSVGAPAWYYLRVKNEITGSTGFGLSIKDYRIAGLIMIGTVALALGIISPLVNLLPIPEWFLEVMKNMGSPTHFAMLIAFVVAAPVLEEIIFRGIILDGLLKKYSPTTAIIASSILFGLIHMNPWQFISAFLGGIFIGWVYYRSRNLSLAIIIHATNNLFFTLPAFFMSEEEYYSFDTPIVEYYGGALPFALIIMGCVALLSFCVWSLHKRLNTGISRVDEE